MIMKTGIFLMKWARSPQNEAKVPFKLDLPLRLRNHVSTKGSTSGASSGRGKNCLTEFFQVTTCLTQNSFDDKYCTREINQFHNCYEDYISQRLAHKEELKKSTPTPGARRLSAKHLNSLLAKYRQGK